MKIIFFGTPEIAVPSLESLKNYPGIEIEAVVTTKDKAVGRKKIITKSPVKIAAEKLDLKIIQPKNKKELFNSLKDTKADFFVVIAFGMILPKEIINLPKHGAINVHASLLPKYRGASPIQEALLNGDTETGVSIIKIDEDLDHGPLYLVKRIKIENDNLPSLTNKMAEESSKILPIILNDIIDGTLSPIPQNDKNATYCRKIKKEDGEINWDKSAEEIKNMINAYTPWPSAYTVFKGKKIKIIETEISEEQLPPGKFILDNNILKIGTKKGTLIPQKVQLEGKKVVDIKNFINGYKTSF
jgi:methionyl-tRNA formyltransferase